MTPIDSSPHGVEVAHSPATPHFPGPRPGPAGDAPGARGDVQPAPPARPETAPDVGGGRRDPLTGAGDDVAG
jgi:hypothetical protein